MSLHARSSCLTLSKVLLKSIVKNLTALQLGLSKYLCISCCMLKSTSSQLPQLARLAFLNAKSLVRLYANPAVIPQKISNNFSLQQVFLVIDSKWRTNFICTKLQITIRQEMHNTMARKMKGFKFLRKDCTNVTVGHFSMPRFLLCKGFDYILDRVDTGQSQLHYCSE